MPKAVVTGHFYRWHEKTGDPTSQILEAERGDEIDVSQEELDRGKSLDLLASPRSKDAKEAAASEQPPA